MASRKYVIFLSLLSLLPLFFQTLACSRPAGEGENCSETKDCAAGLYCLRQRCIKRKKYGTKTEKTDEKSPAHENTLNGEGLKESSSLEPNSLDGSDLPEETLTESSTTIDSSVTDQSVQPEPKPEPQPEPVVDRNFNPGFLTIYDLCDPQSGKRPALRSEVTLKNVVVTSPSARLSSVLNAFFVQADRKRFGNYNYGGIMVIYNRKTIPFNYTIGTLLEIKGKFNIYHSADWKRNCTSDSDCFGQPYRKKCLKLFDSKTKTESMHCAEPIGTPQIELTTAPVALGNHTPPQPVLVKVAEVSTIGTKLPLLRGVLIKLKDLTVTSANPDGPDKDYGEFSVSDPGGSAIRVDDFFNTVTYTGSKYCSCYNNKGDDSYCLPGDTCHCNKPPKRGGLCYNGTPTPNQRKAGDKFDYIIGILRLANGASKVLPRTPTDLMKKP